MYLDRLRITEDKVSVRIKCPREKPAKDFIQPYTVGILYMWSSSNVPVIRWGEREREGGREAEMEQKEQKE